MQFLRIQEGRGQTWCNAVAGKIQAVARSNEDDDRAEEDQHRAYTGVFRPLGGVAQEVQSGE